VARLNEIDRLDQSMNRVVKVINKYVDSIDVNNTQLPDETLYRLVVIKQDCGDLIDYLRDFESYDLG
jgi:hypothetical protein